MNGWELDGWNKEITANGSTVAFEYMGRYWHKADRDDVDKARKKRSYVPAMEYFCLLFGLLLIGLLGMSSCLLANGQLMKLDLLQLWYYRHRRREQILRRRFLARSESNSPR